MKQCPRCQSRMVLDAPLQFHSNHADLSELDYCDAYRCPSCGHYSDAVIERNRARQADERRLLAEAHTIAITAALQVA